MEPEHGASVESKQCNPHNCTSQSHLLHVNGLLSARCVPAAATESFISPAYLLDTASIQTSRTGWSMPRMEMYSVPTYLVATRVARTPYLHTKILVGVVPRGETGTLATVSTPEHVL